MLSTWLCLTLLLSKCEKIIFHESCSPLFSHFWYACWPMRRQGGLWLPSTKFHHNRTLHVGDNIFHILQRHPFLQWTIFFMAPPIQIGYSNVESKHTTVQQFADQFTSNLTPFFLVFPSQSGPHIEIHNYHPLLHSYMLLYAEVATSEDYYEKWLSNACWCGGYCWRFTTYTTCSATYSGRPNRSSPRARVVDDSGSLILFDLFLFPNTFSHGALSLAQGFVFSLPVVGIAASLVIKHPHGRRRVVLIAQVHLELSMHTHHYLRLWVVYYPW